MVSHRVNAFARGLEGPVSGEGRKPSHGLEVRGCKQPHRERLQSLLGCDLSCYVCSHYVGCRVRHYLVSGKIHGDRNGCGWKAFLLLDRDGASRHSRLLHPARLGRIQTTIIPCSQSTWYKWYTLALIVMALIFIVLSSLETHTCFSGTVAFYTTYPCTVARPY